MKDSLKFVGFAFLIVVLLVGLGVEETKAQSLIEITPKELVISGIIDTRPFQHPFTVRAVNENITELTFSPGNLMEITEGKYLIPMTNVQVNPAVTRIKKGQSQDFVVTVQNIPESGQYDGTITVSYKEQPVDAQDTLPICIRAAKFNVTPPQIILKFDKSFLGISGTESVPWTLALNEYSGRAPPEMITTLANSTFFRLDPLVHSEDKSQVIFKEQLLKSVAIDTTPTGQGLTINAIFTNPQVTAGQYSGTLRVQSTDLGIVTSVPVEVQVRYSSWLAWVFIFAGIFVSLMVSWWNTTGKKKNAIHGDALKLREKLSSSVITRTCREKIEDMLNEVPELLDDDKLEDAQNKVSEADSNLKNGVSYKKELQKKAGEVKTMIDDLENVVEKVRVIVNNTDAAVLKDYLHRIKGDLKTLKNDIDQECYQSVDDALKDKITAQEKKLKYFTAPAPDGLLNGLANLEEDMRSFPQAYQDMLEQGFIQPIREDLSNVRRDINIEGLSGKIKSAHTQFKIVDKLLNWDRLIDEYQQTGYAMINAKSELQKCNDYLKSGIYLTEKNVDDIKEAIEKDKLEAKGKLPPSYRQKFDAASSDPDLQKRSIKMASILSEALGTDDLPGKDKLGLMVLLRDIGTSVEISPSEVETAQVPSFEAREAPSPSRLQRLQSHWDSFRQWWTPERKESTINIVLHLIAISILAVLGFSQLYANNPTFGARNVWEEYLALFLWGFGIQTGTATVTGVLKTFRGS